MGSVYLLTLRQLSGKWRLAIMAVLATLPVIITVVMLSQRDTGTSVTEFEIFVISAMLSGSIAPLAVLAIAAAAFGNEVEDRTLANLTIFLRRSPSRRRSLPPARGSRHTSPFSPTRARQLP
jgi:cell division protein FtsW (lipid II flippase)